MSSYVCSLSSNLCYYIGTHFVWFEDAGQQKHSQMLLLLLNLSFFFDLDSGQGCDFQKCVLAFVFPFLCESIGWRHWSCPVTHSQERSSSTQIIVLIYSLLLCRSNVKYCRIFTFPMDITRWSTLKSD